MERVTLKDFEALQEALLQTRQALCESREREAALEKLRVASFPPPPPRRTLEHPVGSPVPMAGSYPEALNPFGGGGGNPFDDSAPLAVGREASVQTEGDGADQEDAAAREQARAMREREVVIRERCIAARRARASSARALLRLIFHAWRGSHAQTCILRNMMLQARGVGAASGSAPAGAHAAPPTPAPPTRAPPEAALPASPTLPEAAPAAESASPTPSEAAPSRTAPAVPLAGALATAPVAAPASDVAPAPPTEQAPLPLPLRQLLCEDHGAESAGAEGVAPNAEGVAERSYQLGAAHGYRLGAEHGYRLGAEWAERAAAGATPSGTQGGVARPPPPSQPSCDGTGVRTPPRAASAARGGAAASSGASSADATPSCASMMTLWSEGVVV
jgi:hypothetical protein